MDNIVEDTRNQILTLRVLNTACKKYMSFEKYNEIYKMYEHSSRHYHNTDHLLNVASYIIKNTNEGTPRDTLLVITLLHDAIYSTTSKTNEEDSAALVRFLDTTDEIKRSISQTILFTKYQRVPENEYEEIFMKADLEIFNASKEKQLEFEKKIFKEYFWVPIADYVPARVQILKDLKDRYGCNTDFLVDYLENKKWNVGFYPGTFYPFHIGHKSILKQAEKMFDKVIIGFGNTTDKTTFKWDSDTYGELNGWVKSNYQSVELNSLITENIAEIRQYADSVTLIRGLRNSSDLIYEQNYLQALRDMDQRVNAAYFMTEPNLAHVSSSLIRGILKLSPKNVYNYYRI